ncbi:HEXXH motif domain-containing protein [Sphaerisporangium melleum]|uniref:HEXXH motif domain-containing protein n=1 Tax=Sphaerisporangium melleum TaxID=321316 RepID=A0A917RQM7_9ACTN|nr:HEXXH motif-containing putative peptide modification protein [Sphaerisporangium melleum]GGL18076.1 HEXXH motif domain-containing protein [Sphaerisporangium melleum]GII73081.1 HEXXH motif domain-containing protein [Sphaerisporangium melleum]
MAPRSQALPPDVVAALAAGGGGGRAARHLAALQERAHRMLLLGVVREATASGHPGAPATARAFELLAGLERRAPDAVRRVIRHPSAGAWARAAYRQLRAGVSGGQAMRTRESGPGRPRTRENGHDPARGRDGGGHDPKRMGAVAAAAAALARFPCRVEVPAPGGWADLPGLGRVRARGGGPEAVVRVGEDGGLEVDGEPAVLEPLHGLVTEDGGLRLLVDDLDAYRWDPARVPGGRLAAAERERWGRCLDGAWRTLRSHHWTVAEECRAMLTVLTPIKGTDTAVDSACSPDHFGAIALSPPPDALWLAMTFAHELQHAKLGALADAVRLTLPDDRLYYAPWRHDPRPLPSLLQGAYAHLGVAGFWRRQRAFEPGLRPHVEFAHWRAATHTAIGTLLGSERLTDEGRRFVSAMRATVARWLAEPVPGEALEAGRAQAAAHRTRWRTQHGPDA